MKNYIQEETVIRKGNDGWKGRTNIFLGNEKPEGEKIVQTLQIISYKNSRGLFVVSGTVGQMERKDGWESFKFGVFESPNKSVSFDKSRITEKVAAECHALGVEQIKQHFQLV